MRNSRKERIGILGGTFNPVHLGHLILAQGAIDAFELDKVLFIPCGVPAHKDPGVPIGSEHRLAMVRAAIAGDCRFEASDVEIRRGGVSYAVDTVTQLHGLYPGAELIFVIGSDTLPELYLWKNIYTLLSLCRFGVFCRPGYDPASASPGSLHLDEPWATRVLEGVSAGRQIDISSSDIRYRLAEGMSIRYLVPAAVEAYIAAQGLYRQGG
jgi:nicotinate-nucleotide adenylyltransferase